MLLETKYRDFSLKIHYKKIKRLYLRVDDWAEVKISAPKGVKLEYIQEFIDKNYDFIRQEVEKKQAEVEKRFFHELSTGDKIKIFDTEYSLLRINQATKDSCKINEELKTIELSVQKKRAKDILIKFLTEKLTEKIIPALDFWQKRTNLYCQEWKIKNMKSRWGSCKPSSKTLCFNLQLVHQEEKYLEYIILHELIHLIEPSHNANFKRHLSHYMPNWQILRKELNTAELTHYN
ncbi:MAG: M48 family metallopeptidase [Cardiobacteriaceae bacterium]|nr:M48 family metallopeptidase [Cardiobacteriaceae bacterium]